ncbi:TPA: LysE family translocator [Klebsiella oxytoca]|nr:LysE family translocator [Klebsiella oxytoca]
MTDSLIAYSIASLAVTVVPGPTMLLSLTNGVSRSPGVITMGILGAACSDILLISAAALGLGTIMLASETLFSIVRWTGVIYLLWLAVELLRSKTTPMVPDADRNDSKTRSHPVCGKKAFFRSLFVALSNPKGLLFFGAFLPQFLDLSQPAFTQYISFALLTVIIDIAVMGLYATAGFHAARNLSVNYLLWINRLSAATLACVATGLAIYRRQA